MLTSKSNSIDFDLSDNENSNDSGYSSDDDAKNRTNQIDNDEEKICPYGIENLCLDHSNDELTEHHTGANGALSQRIKINQEARKSMRMTK